MILLTGATGNVGSALLRRLTADGERVRCLVRDPRRLGPERVRVQIALGDLSDPGSFRNAMRGVKTVVHLAAAIRDQPRGSIEELNGVATLRLVRAAERAGAERFVFFSAMGASEHAPTRFLRAKALAERAVAESSVPSTIFAPSIVYSPDNHWMRLLERLTLLPAVPISGIGRARLPADLGRGRRRLRCARRSRRDGDAHERYELAGPDTLTYDDMARLVLRVARAAAGGCCTCRCRSCAPLLRGVRGRLGAARVATWDEAQLMEAPMTDRPRHRRRRVARGQPLPMREVLAAS